MLYRKLATVFCEAISNFWDAAASEVQIHYSAEQIWVLIKDDGHGMTSDDFHKAFLRID